MYSTNYDLYSEALLLIKIRRLDGQKVIIIFGVDLSLLAIRCRLCPIKAKLDMITRVTGVVFGV